MAQPIDFNKSEQYILSIRLSTDGFLFLSITLSNRRKYISSSSPVNTQRGDRGVQQAAGALLPSGDRAGGG